MMTVLFNDMARCSLGTIGRPTVDQFSKRAANYSTMTNDLFSPLDLVEPITGHNYKFYTLTYTYQRYTGNHCSYTVQQLTPKDREGNTNCEKRDTSYM